MEYKAIIFDLDGTLLDTLDDLTDSVNYVMEHMGFSLHTREDIRSFLGNGIRMLMARSIPQGEENPNFEEAFLLFQSYYLSHNRIKTKPYDGIMELLQRLKESNVPMAIVSNKNQPAVDLLLKEVFHPYIEVAIGDEPNRKRKPDAAGVFEALRRLEICEEDWDQVLFVGDSEVDAQTAVNASVDCALCAWGFRQMEVLEQLPHKVVLKHPLELLELICK